MRIDLVIKATAVTAGLVITVTGAALMLRGAPSGTSDATEVGGVTMSAPGDPSDTSSNASAGRTRATVTDEDAADSAARPLNSTETTPTETSRTRSSSGSRPASKTDGSTAVVDRTAPSALKDPAMAKKPGGGGNTGGPKPGGALPIEAKGSVAGLYPGHREYLPLHLENKNNFAVSVAEMSITVAGTGSCGASNITLPQAWTAQRIEANGERTVLVPIEMVASATNDCAGKSFGLTYSGKAVKA